MDIWTNSTVLFSVLRLLTPLEMSYEAAKKRAEPYTKIVEELPDVLPHLNSRQVVSCLCVPIAQIIRNV
jgi:hypothetical protein